MGNVSRILEPRLDWAQSESGRSAPQAERNPCSAKKRADLGEPAGDGDPLSAARGAVLGVALGSVLWAVILWVFVWVFV